MRELEPSLAGRDPQGFVTREPAMLAILETAAQVATSTVPVLISGESGTGKELIARAIHAMSGRSGRFVTVNSGAFTRDLLENEIARMIALHAGGPLGPELLSARVRERSAAVASPLHLAARLDAEEKRAIEEALAKEHQNRTRAAKRLGISRESLRIEMIEHGLTSPPATPSRPSRS
jgi:DNA-binding NtrC family response regulator